MSNEIRNLKSAIDAFQQAGGLIHNAATPAPWGNSEEVTIELSDDLHGDIAVSFTLPSNSKIAKSSSLSRPSKPS